MTAVNPYIEPGIQPLFRWFCGIMFGLITLGIWAETDTPDYFAIIVWFTMGFLALYLTIRPLARWMGKWYLIIALLLAIFVPTIADTGVNPFYAQQNIVDDELSGNGARLYFWLILPLIIISAQYSKRALFAFTLSTSLLPIVISAIFDPATLTLQITNSTGRLVIFSIVGYLVNVIASAQRRQRKQLAEKNAQLIHYAATLEQLTIAQERNRLARELHDTLAHTLSAVNVQLKALEVLMEQDSGDVRSALLQTQDLTQRGIQESRRALQALRASPIEEFGLATAIRRLAQQAAQRAGFQLTLKLPETKDVLAPEIEQHLYRITEEALNNVVRHAHARNVSLSLEMKLTRLRLSVADDGVGFIPTNTSSKRYGLKGMQERADLINGQLKIESQPEKGTTLTLILDRGPQR